MKISSAFVLAAIAMVATAGPVPRKCTQACPYIYMPVCGQLKSGEVKTFGNACELNAYNCKNPANTYSTVAEHECDVPDKCNLACPKIYMPVCGQLETGAKKTFGNACELGVYNCQNPTNLYTTIAEQACDAPEKCTEICPTIYQPVCGQSKNGEKRTFGNACELNAFNCQHSADPFLYIAENECA
ncbi:hypothetical protein BGZ76_004199 [Entomortierella beljakovae]|nr:hypothetical protein BGZ76_004199 [Entomortierella beljakovae]